MKRIFDYIFYMRPVLFFPAWSTILILSGTLEVVVPLEIFISSSFLMGGCFILNQISDIESDKKNNKCLFLEKGYFNKKSSIFYALILLILALSILYTVSLFSFYIGVAFVLITGYLYNFKPFELKQTTVGGAVSNFLMGLLISLIIFKSINISLNEVFVLSLFNFTIYLLTTLPDSKGDIATSKHTVGNQFGLKKTLSIALFFCLLSIAIARNVDHVLYITLSFIQLIVLFFQLLIKNDFIISIIKVLLLIQAMIAIMYYPIYILPIILVYVGGRAYYKSQFNMEYPSLKNE